MVFIGKRGRAIISGLVGMAATDIAHTNFSKRQRVAPQPQLGGEMESNGDISASTAIAYGLPGEEKDEEHLIAIPGVARGVRYPANSEFKWVDYASHADELDTTGTITLVNGVAEGTGADQRVGRVVFNKAYSVLGKVSYEGSATTQSQGVRIALVWDKFPGGDLPTILDIYDSVNAKSFTKLDSRARFTVLKDVTWALSAHNTTSSTLMYSGGPTAYLVDFTVNLGDRRTIYSGTGATVGSIQTGALYMLTMGDEAQGGDFRRVSRHLYID